MRKKLKWFSITRKESYTICHRDKVGFWWTSIKGVPWHCQKQESFEEHMAIWNVMETPSLTSTKSYFGATTIRTFANSTHTIIGRIGRGMARLMTEWTYYYHHWGGLNPERSVLTWCILSDLCKTKALLTGMIFIQITWKDWWMEHHKVGTVMAIHNLPISTRSNKTTTDNHNTFILRCFLMLANSRRKNKVWARNFVSILFFAKKLHKLNFYRYLELGHG